MNGELHTAERWLAAGVPGVVVRLGKAFARVEAIDDTRLKCGGGASGILVSSTARDAGIAGLEFLRSIPGTVGGFVGRALTLRGQRLAPAPYWALPVAAAVALGVALWGIPISEGDGKTRATLELSDVPGAVTGARASSP